MKRPYDTIPISLLYGINSSKKEKKNSFQEILQPLVGASSAYGANNVMTSVSILECSQITKDVTLNLNNAITAAYEYLQSDSIY